MSTYIELVNRAEAAALAAEQSALNTTNNKNTVQGYLTRMEEIVSSVDPAIIKEGETLFGKTGTFKGGGGTFYECVFTESPRYYRLTNKSGTPSIYDGLYVSSNTPSVISNYERFVQTDDGVVVDNPHYLEYGTSDLRLFDSSGNQLNVFGNVLSNPEKYIDSNTTLIISVVLNTDTKWLGIPVVLDSNGYYHKTSSDPVELSYTNITPVIGKIYPANALFEVSKYWYETLGLVLKAMYTTGDNELGGSSSYNNITADENGYYWFTEPSRGATYSPPTYTPWNAKMREFSLSFKFKYTITSSDNSYNGVVFRIGKTNSGWFQLRAYENGNVRLEGGQGITWDTTISNFTLTPDTEHNISVVMTRVRCYLIIDGVIVHRWASVDRVEVNDYLWFHYIGGSENLQMGFKEVQLFNRIRPELIPVENN